ncbi:Fungal transcriptional regulatory protein, N-terminal [Penicillium camemberti]|uniref:Fungal transcriptional regulatory protein, N-terminal n=1 Tax=Penicillium camemberti (strain FM 013) TaxID=1429867 RepID=A0A0G4PPN0_PENC3|nr:Fungal transcriptional regulatory protein, N-terminal [Penicillium camemberti]
MCFPPDAAKRTPLACQACRRRKTKCDSDYPCAICEESGEVCMREPSSMRELITTVRFHCKRSLGEEQRPNKATEEEGEEEEEDADGLRCLRL